MDAKKFKKQSGFNDDRDSYVTEEGDIVYLEWVDDGRRWVRREVARIPYAELEASGQTEIVFLIDESDRDMDLQKDRDGRNADKCMERKKTGYAGGGDDMSFDESPIDQIPDPHGDVFDQLFPEEEVPEKPEVKAVREIVEKLSPAEQDVFWRHYGECKFLEDIRREDIEKNGSAPTQQMYSKRKNKIIARACDALGVRKPRKRSK